MKIDPRQSRDAENVLDTGVRWGGVSLRLRGEAMRMIGLLFGLFATLSCSGQVARPANQPWTAFVRVEGQPEPVPAEWVATPEGKFAHSIKIPNPVPKESGYRRGMTSEQYFDYLCKTEAGEFIYKTVENVDGFYFMRPPKRPRDDDLKDRYRLEAPEIERTFQLVRPVPQERGITFVNPPWALYSYVEEPSQSSEHTKSYVRIYGYRQDHSPMAVESKGKLESSYGLIWRGLRRPNDRELAVAGSEWIALDLRTREVLAVQRDYGRTGRTPNTPQGIWWLNALNCPKSSSKHIRSSRIYDFVVKSLRPNLGDKK